MPKRLGFRPRRASVRRGLRLRDCNPYGLTAAELRAEIRRCARQGWQLWEIRRRFGCCDCKDNA